ncbi:MAG: ATP-binding cassette, subfamily bacterial [Patescibacteria group bacterium]|nr:ATP-binding cassette, subfamily bacterial [Patescibacteria group bacterium]
MLLKKIFRHVWPIIMQYKWSFFLTFIFFAGSVVFDYIIKTLYLKKIIDVISGSDLPRVALADTLFGLVGMTALTLGIAFIFSRLGNWSQNYFRNNALRELSNYSFQKITNHSHNFFTNHFTGGLVTKSKRFTSAFRSITSIMYINFWATLIMLVSAFVVLFIEVPNLASFFLLWVLFYIFIMYQFVKIKFPYDLRSSAADSKVGSRLADVFTNIFTLKVFSARDQEIESFKKVTQDESVHRGRAWFFGNTQRAIKALLMISAQTVVLYITVKLWINVDITTGMIVLIQTYVFAIMSRLWDLDDAIFVFMENVSEMSEVIDIFEIKPDVLEPQNPEESRMVKGNISFKNVSFVYDAGSDVFENFSLNIHEGERIGLVGHSGAGKSTITKLLLRFIDVADGSIEIDGQNIKNVLQDDLRRAIAYVPQEPILFHRSIRENIAYGKPEATDEEIISAAKRAHAHEFIATLKDSYDTLVGERGVKLSGGERQRVSIARVMLTRAPILILDEATSSLDSVSESYIQDAFGELMKGKTTIVIAHRLSTIQKMDRIIVLDKGKITEEGTHKELLEKGGTYAELWNRQTGGFLE